MLEPLTEKQIYAVPPALQLYPECSACGCVTCAYWRSDCGMCALCLFRPAVFRCCRRYLPLVLSREPYRSYLRELDSSRTANCVK